MAKKPTSTSGSKISNIMDYTRGLFDFGKPVSEDPKPKGYGSSELISSSLKTKILSGSLRATEASKRARTAPANSLMTMVSTSYSKVGQERLENRRILQLMPEVGKAARLMVASIFSPNDLSRHEIKIHFEMEGVTPEIQTKIGDLATKFFQKKLNLKTSAPSWVYQFGYETGSTVFAIVPLQTFEKIQDESYIGTESFVKQIVEPLCHESLFGFGDSNAYLNENKQDVVGLESFSSDILKDFNKEHQLEQHDTNASLYSKEMIEAFIGSEALNLTDNPSVLRVNESANDKRTKRTADKLRKHFKTALHEPVVEFSSDDLEGSPAGNPLLIRLPPESVTVIHTPGEPADHQGYLVLLDITGNPVSVITQEHDEADAAANFNKNKSSLFSQINQAYGMGTNNRSAMDRQTMEHIYTRVVSRHLEKRLGKAGYGRVEIPNLDATMRCMFTRLLQEKRTRILFLPKDLVTYMTFETDEHGYGVSKLNGIKFALGMKMAVQVARVMAAIKAAMDKRNITMKFDDNMMEQPEQMFETMIQQYIQKSVMSFSTDPGYIQSQIAQKSFSVKAEGIPGMENFSVTNEADAKTSSSDFDAGMTEYLDKSIINGLGVPASTMNSLNEDEYARSVTTTNLFFAMEVSIYQDIVIKHVSDLIRKYGRYSEEFQKELVDLLPELKSRKKISNSSTDESTNDKKDDKDSVRLPADCGIDDVINHLLISLPKPNIAPSKAQFDSLEGMTTALGNMMTSLFPDELAGTDDKLRPVIALLRARFTAVNVRAYLESVGMSGIDVPDGSFTDQLKSLSDLQNGLYNIAGMLEAKIKLAQPVEDATAIPGYQ